jgi:hypothetical protein
VDVTSSAQMNGQPDFFADVYPNPFSADITIEVENAAREYDLQILDHNGNLISRSTSTSSRQVMHLQDLPPAPYILRISLKGSDQSRIFQILKSR